MDSNKPLARAAHFIALLLVVIPLVDATMSVWPLRLGDERWRFGAIGTLSNITLVPLLGLLIALGFATWMDQRRIRRVVGWVSAIFAIGIAVLAVFFILDYFQTKTIVQPRFQSAMGVATTTALIKNIVTILALFLISRAGFAGPKAVVRKKQVVATEPPATPLIPMSGASRAE